MQRKFYLLCTILAFVGLSTKSQAQIFVSTAINDLGLKAGIGYAINKTFSLDANLYSASDFSNLSPEFLLRTNIVQQNDFKVHFGAGVITNQLYSLVFPVGVDLKILPNTPNFCMRFETIIMAGLDGNPNHVLPTLGLIYRFGK